MSLVGPNDTCPCWSGKKFKHCCRGRINWDAIIRSGRNQAPYMSIRGRNILFAGAIGDALQLNKVGATVDLNNYKRAFTDRAVVKIYEAIMELWSPDTDIAELLERSKSDVAGLYVGDYSPAYLHRAVVRHSTYASKILIVDPFQHPYTTSNKYNPILNPGQHRGQTLRNVNLFFSLLPWIDEGLLEVVRTPADFSRKLAWQFMENAERIRGEPEIAAAADAGVNEISERHMEQFKQRSLLLSAPDQYLRKIMQDSGIVRDSAGQDEFLRYVQRLRDADPNFLEPLSPGKHSSQLEMMYTGGTVEAARLTAQMASAYLFTDLDVRWKLIQADRANHSAETSFWSPFAKSVQNTRLSFLNNVGLEHALRLRRENRLLGVRNVMRQAWKKEQTGDAYDEINTLAFTENFASAVAEAQSEWERIKSDLVRYTGVEAAGSLTAAGPLIASGNALWLAGATVALGAASAIYARWATASFWRRFPAGFFMKLDDAD